MTAPTTSNQDRVYIFDTTLRDGEQCPGATMTFEEKIKVAELLDNMGVDIIEAGYPFASDGDFEAVREIAKRAKNSVICGLSPRIMSRIAYHWCSVTYIGSTVIAFAVAYVGSSATAFRNSELAPAKSRSHASSYANAGCGDASVLSIRMLRNAACFALGNMTSLGWYPK